MLWSTLTSFISHGFTLIEEPLQINLLGGRGIPPDFIVYFVDFLLLCLFTSLLGFPSREPFVAKLPTHK